MVSSSIVVIIIIGISSGWLILPNFNSSTFGNDNVSRVGGEEGALDCRQDGPRWMGGYHVVTYFGFVVTHDGSSAVLFVDAAAAVYECLCGDAVVVLIMMVMSRSKDF